MTALILIAAAQVASVPLAVLAAMRARKINTKPKDTT